jgi:anaphase-promoting complex subunit 11
MKMKIQQWHAVATWKYDFEMNMDTCTICQNEFEKPCPGCKTPLDSCIPGRFIINLNSIDFY